MVKECKYTEDTEKRIIHVEIKVKELCANQDNFSISQADMLRKQDDLMKKVEDIHDALVGKGEYDIEEDGGICGESKRIRRDVDNLKTWRTKLTAIWLTVSGIFTVAIALLTLWLKSKVNN